MNRTQQKSVLEAFRKVLGQELHNLRKSPEILWQQMFNRLQWKHDPVLEVLGSQLMYRTTQSKVPWFHIRTPLQEAEALLKTLPHEGTRTCSISPNGELLCSMGHLVLLWDTGTGAELARYDDTDDPTVSCAFDYSGNYLLTGTGKGKIHIRDARTLHKMVELKMDNGKAYCATSPVKSLAAIACGSVLRIIELPSGSERILSTVNEGAFTCCTFSNDGEMIATGDDKGRLSLWDAGTLDLHLQWSFTAGSSNRNPIKTCAFSPDLSFVAIVCKNSDSIMLLGGPDDTGKPRTIPLRHNDKVNYCEVSPDGRLLVFVSDDHLIWLQEIKDLKLPMSALEGHTAPVIMCTFSTNGSVLATVSKDDTIKLWGQPIKKHLGGLTGHSERVTSVTFSQDGSYIFSGSADMTLKMWKPAPTAEKNSFEGHLGPVWDCVVLKGNTLLASVGDDAIRFWDIKTGQQNRVLHVSDVHALAYSPDGYLLATGGYDSMIMLWDIATGQCIKKSNIEGGRIHDCEFTEDGNCLLMACDDGTLRLWNLTTWREIYVLRGHKDLVTCCAIVKRSSMAVSGSQDRTLRLWDLNSGSELHIFEDHKDSIWDCSVSASGSIIVSLGWDGNLRIWDISSKMPVANYYIPTRLRSIALHPSEPRVACGDYNGQVHVIDLMGSLKSAY